VLHVCKTSTSHRERAKWSAAIYQIASSASPSRNDVSELSLRTNEVERGDLPDCFVGFAFSQ
jgi:hypothetical protein